jgi:hypothetical protein
MLSNKDKIWLAEMMETKVRQALTVKVRFEKRRNIESGQPLAVPEIEVKDVYLPDHWVEFLPFYEAAIRGVQETSDHTKNNSVKSLKAVEAVAGIMLGFEGNLKSIGSFAGEINKRIEYNKQSILLRGEAHNSENITDLQTRLEIEKIYYI